jgi:murein DD-endopeptidase MepM/ murein hydrolase activator NlpD
MGPTLLVLAAAAILTSDQDVELLRARQLAVPVLGVAREDLHDSFDDARAGHRHEALDIPAPSSTPVVAVEDGSIAQLFVSVAGGITVYQFDPSKAYAYYYAHLDRWADGLHQGQAVRRGDVIGYVGTTGNAGETAHLHFGIAKLGSASRWWEGTPIDPYLVLR